LSPAAEQGHVHCLQWLLERGADCYITDDAGETPKDVAKRFAQLAAVELLTQRTGDSNSSDEELDANNAKFFERHGVEGSTDSKEDLILNKAEKRNAHIRAYRKIQELQHLLEIAYGNYRQLGGITEEEKKMKKEQRGVEKPLPMTPSSPHHPPCTLPGLLRPLIRGTVTSPRLYIPFKFSEKM
uniref:Ankyrin repeat domain-containing protein 42 n=1 Tax=Anas platyrhynchos TaxID=8839 RepID=A0A8B9SGR0_ANAPL